MIKSTVDHAVRLGHPAAQTFQVFQSASMRFRAGGDERLGSRIRPRQSKDLMTCVDKFRNNGGADKTGSAGEKDTHGGFLHFVNWGAFASCSSKMKRGSDTIYVARPYSLLNRPAW